ncbi:MAG: hypothetical protein ACP5VQ_03115, partial [Phycisphaerae bacterium]
LCEFPSCLISIISIGQYWSVLSVLVSIISIGQYYQCWSLVVGRWSLVVGHWSLVIGAPRATIHPFLRSVQRFFSSAFRHSFPKICAPWSRFGIAASLSA